MTKKIYAKHINPNEPTMRDRYPDEDSPAHKAKVAKSDARKDLVGIADQIAGDTLWIRNWKFPGADKLFPNDPDMRLVDKYYPNARKRSARAETMPGIFPLLADEPGDQREVEKAFAKQKELKALGFRHVVIERDTTLFDALEQLGEV